MSDSDKVPPSGNNAGTATKVNNQTQNKNPNPWTGKKPGGGGGNPTNPNNKKKFQGETKKIEDDIFYYGSGMDTKFIASKDKVLNYISTKYSSSESVSIESNIVTLLGHTAPKKIKKKADLEAMEYWEQEQWSIDMKRYTDNMHSLTKNLTACYAIIWGQMTTGLQNQVKRDSTFKAIEQQRNAPGLFALVAKICNKASNIDHFMTHSVNALYGIMNLSGNKMGIGEYYKIFNEKRKAADNAGIELHSSKQTTECRDALVAKNNWTTSIPGATSDYINWNSDIKANTQEQFYALIFLKQAGDRYEEVRRELTNDFAKGNDNIPMNVEEAYSLLSLYKFEPKKQNPPKGGKKPTTQEDNFANNKAKFPGHSFQQKDFP